MHSVLFSGLMAVVFVCMASRKVKLTSRLCREHPGSAGGFAGSSTGEPVYLKNRTGRYRKRYVFWAMCRVLVVTSLVATGACSSSHVVQTWANPELEKPRRILVFGVTDQEGLRRRYEDVMSRALTVSGVWATPSYDVVRTEGQAHQERVRQVVKKAGFDAVLITRLVRLTKHLEAVSEPQPLWGPGFSRYQSPYWPSYYYDSYRLVEHEFAYVESNLYQTDSSKLLVSITTRTQDPTYSSQQIQDVVDLTIEEFRKQGLLLPL